MISGHRMSIAIDEIDGSISAAKERSEQFWTARCECGWIVGSDTRAAVGRIAFRHLERIEQSTLPKPHFHRWQYSG